MERDIDRARKRAGCAAINPVDILAGRAATAFHDCHWEKKKL